MTKQNFPNLDPYVITETRDALHAGTTWQTEGFNGALLRYADLSKSTNPKDCLISLWTQMLSAGDTHMLET